MIFHVTTAAEWDEARASGIYTRSTRGKTLDEVGYIHCSHAHQVDRIGRFLYGDATEPVVVLAIDESALEVPVVDENLEGGDETFPHIYGPLPVAAVTEVRPFG